MDANYDEKRTAMHRWNSVDELIADATRPPAVVTIGNFDGLHKGHQAVLEHVMTHAEIAGLEPIAVTFDPHPLHVVRPELAPPLLTTPDRRVELMARAGIAGVLVLPFTREMAAWTPEHFIDTCLVAALRARDVVIGADFRFGARGAGTVETLRRRGVTKDFRVHMVDDVTGDDRRWSSTWVRELLQAGDARGAADVLGRPHRVDGLVVHGDHRGRELGFPTANVAAETLVPGDGVYAGWLEDLDVPRDHPDRTLPAAVSIGTNPTFEGGRERRCEAYVLDRDDLDLYGHRVGAHIVDRLRGTERFDDVAALVDQMHADVAMTREILATDPRP